MKTKAIQLTIALMMLTVFTYAQKAKTNSVWVSIMLKGKEKVEIRIVKPAGEVVILNVYDETNKKVLFRRIAKESNLLISHYISPFPYGEYTYEVKSKKQIILSTQIIKSSKNDLVYKPLEWIDKAK